MQGYSRNREDFLELLYHKYKPMEELNGCIDLWESITDYLLTWAEVDELPELSEQDTKIYEYNQSGTVHCTLYSAFWAISDLFNYEFKQSEIDEMVEESYKRGRIKWEWWYIKSAVDLVADYWNEKHSDLWKVVYYRVDLTDTELVDKILKKNYTLCSGYRGNSKYNSDRNDNWILNWTTFWTSTYGHAVSWIGREGKRFIKDNYKGRKSWKLFTNIYEVEHKPSELVNGNCYYYYAYVYVKVNNKEEVKRLNEFKTSLQLAIELNSKIWWLTNDQAYRAKLHDMNELNRKKVQDCDTQLRKYQ
jgi:hypothetical protein